MSELLPSSKKPCKIMYIQVTSLLGGYIISQPGFLHLKAFPVAQMVEHGASNAKIMGSIPRESKS